MLTWAFKRKRWACVMLLCVFRTNNFLSLSSWEGRLGLKIFFDSQSPSPARALMPVQSPPPTHTLTPAHLVLLLICIDGQILSHHLPQDGHFVRATSPSTGINQQQSRSHPLPEWLLGRELDKQPPKFGCGGRNYQLNNESSGGDDSHFIKKDKKWQKKGLFTTQ